MSSGRSSSASAGAAPMAPAMSVAAVGRGPSAREAEASMADEGFLQRWSRRKAEARSPLQEREPAPDPIAERELAAETGDPPASATRGDVRAGDDGAAVDLDALPDIDTLTYESDFTVFMRKGVPSELRKRALQRLWRSNPTLA